MIPLRSSDYRHVMTVQQGTETAAAGGGATVAWTTYATIRASVDPSPGGESATLDQVAVASQTAVVRTRYQAGITTTMRLVWGSRTFEIVSHVNPDGLGRESVLGVSEVGI